MDTEKNLVDEPMLRYFEYDHLPKELALVSSWFHNLAHRIVESQERTPERTVALRKLLESKDAAVRNALEVKPKTEKI